MSGRPELLRHIAAKPGYDFRMTVRRTEERQQGGSG